jgi:hypothetical protein
MRAPFGFFWDQPSSQPAQGDAGLGRSARLEPAYPGTENGLQLNSKIIFMNRFFSAIREQEPRYGEEDKEAAGTGNYAAPHRA